MNEDIKPEFSFLVKVGQISGNPITVTLDADDKECQALAVQWRVNHVKALKATVTLTRWKRDGVRVKGKFDAKLVQTCVASLTPIDTHYSEQFNALFVPETSKLARMDNIQLGELIIDPEGPDVPDTFEGNAIDIAQIIAEYVALEIDDYPRHPEVKLENHSANVDEDEKMPSPFASLSAIRDKLQ